ncbi:MAG: nitronate monooxygenase [Myxococcota bacterium]|nr:nitronate monooxygenase [Myxococcota bacterium]
MIVESLMQAGSAFLGSTYPIICGAMTWVSDAKLVAAIGNAGGFGLLAGGNAEVEALREEILLTRQGTQHPFGVNLITIAPNYRKQLDMVCEMGCSKVVFAGSFPRAAEIAKAKESGAQVICFAPTQVVAHKLIDWGADALILEGSEAGGHVGPVSLSVLIQQLLFEIDTVPIFVAGGIATGRWMAHLLLMGAAGVQLGTRFVMSEECSAHENFKRAFRRAKARDAMATPQFDSRLPVIPVRALKNTGTTAFGKLQVELIKKLEDHTIDREHAQFEVERFWMGALRRAVVEGDVETGSLMAGQSVGLVSEIKPLAAIIEELVEEARQTIDIIHNRFHDT